MEDTQFLECTQVIDIDEGDRRNAIVGWLEVGTIKYELCRGENFIGRNPATCSVLFAHSLGVSKEHAVLDVSASGVTIKDLGSRNKTKIDKLVLKPHDRYVLHGNETLTFGNISAVYRAGEVSVENSAYIDSDDTLSLSSDSCVLAPDDPIHQLSEPDLRVNDLTIVSGDDQKSKNPPDVALMETETSLKTSCSGVDAIFDDSDVVPSSMPPKRSPLKQLKESTSTIHSKATFQDSLSAKPDRLCLFKPRGDYGCTVVNESDDDDSDLEESLISPTSLPVKKFMFASNSCSTPTRAFLAPSKGITGCELVPETPWANARTCSKSKPKDMETNVNAKSHESSFNTVENLNKKRTQPIELSKSDGMVPITSSVIAEENNLKSLCKNSEEDKHEDIVLTQDVLSAFGQSSDLSKDDTQDILAAFATQVTPNQSPKYQLLSSEQVFKKPCITPARSNKKCVEPLEDQLTQCTFEPKDSFSSESCKKPTEAFSPSEQSNTLTKMGMNEIYSASTQQFDCLPTQVFNSASHKDEQRLLQNDSIKRLVTSTVSSINDSLLSNLNVSEDSLSDLATQPYLVNEKNFSSKLCGSIESAFTQPFKENGEIAPAKSVLTDSISDLATQVFRPEKDVLLPPAGMDESDYNAATQPYESKLPCLDESIGQMDTQIINVDDLAPIQQSDDLSDIATQPFSVNTVATAVVTNSVFTSSSAQFLTAKQINFIPDKSHSNDNDSCDLIPLLETCSTCSSADNELLSQPLTSHASQKTDEELDSPPRSSSVYCNTVAEVPKVDNNFEIRPACCDDHEKLKVTVITNERYSPRLMNKSCEQPEGGSTIAAEQHLLTVSNKSVKKCRNTVNLTNDFKDISNDDTALTPELNGNLCETDRSSTPDLKANTNEFGRISTSVLNVDSTEDNRASTPDLNANKGEEYVMTPDCNASKYGRDVETTLAKNDCLTDMPVKKTPEDVDFNLTPSIVSVAMGLTNVEQPLCPRIVKQTLENNHLTSDSSPEPQRHLCELKKDKEADSVREEVIDCARLEEEINILRENKDDKGPREVTAESLREETADGALRENVEVPRKEIAEGLGEETVEDSPRTTESSCGETAESQCVETSGNVHPITQIVGCTENAIKHNNVSFSASNESTRKQSETLLRQFGSDLKNVVSPAKSESNNKSPVSISHSINPFANDGKDEDNFLSDGDYTDEEYFGNISFVSDSDDCTSKSHRAASVSRSNVKNTFYSYTGLDNRLMCNQLSETISPVTYHSTELNSCARKEQSCISSNRNISTNVMECDQQALSDSSDDEGLDESQTLFSLNLSKLNATMKFSQQCLSDVKRPAETESKFLPKCPSVISEIDTANASDGLLKRADKNSQPAEVSFHDDVENETTAEKSVTIQQKTNENSESNVVNTKNCREAKLVNDVKFATRKVSTLDCMPAISKDSGKEHTKNAAQNTLEQRNSDESSLSTIVATTTDRSSFHEAETDNCQEDRSDACHSNVRNVCANQHSLPRHSRSSRNTVAALQDSLEKSPLRRGRTCHPPTRYSPEFKISSRMRDRQSVSVELETVVDNSSKNKSVASEFCQTRENITDSLTNRPKRGRPSKASKLLKSSEEHKQTQELPSCIRRKVEKQVNDTSIEIKNITSTVESGPVRDCSPRDFISRPKRGNTSKFETSNLSIRNAIKRWSTSNKEDNLSKVKLQTDSSVVNSQLPMRRCREQCEEVPSSRLVTAGRCRTRASIASSSVSKEMTTIATRSGRSTRANKLPRTDEETTVLDGAGAQPVIKKMKLVNDGHRNYSLCSRVTSTRSSGGDQDSISSSVVSCASSITKASSHCVDDVKVNNKSSKSVDKSLTSEACPKRVTRNCKPIASEEAVAPDVASIQVPKFSSQNTCKTSVNSSAPDKNVDSFGAGEKRGRGRPRKKSYSGAKSNRDISQEIVSFNASSTPCASTQFQIQSLSIKDTCSITSKCIITAESTVSAIGEKRKRGRLTKQSVSELTTARRLSTDSSNSITSLTRNEDDSRLPAKGARLGKVDLPNTSCQETDLNCSVSSIESFTSSVGYSRLKRASQQSLLSTTAKTTLKRRCSVDTLNCSLSSLRSWSPSQRQTKASLKPRVLFTGLVPSKEQEKTLDKLGASIVESVEECTVLVAEAAKRTCKLLACTIRGVPIVTQSWLSSSASAKAFTDPWQFLVNDIEMERKFGFNLARTLRKASSNKRKLFADFCIHATRSVRPAPQQIKELVELGGGAYLNRPPRVFKPGYVVVSCEEDRTLWTSFRKSTLPIVSTEFILTGILRCEVNVAAFLLES